MNILLLQASVFPSVTWVMSTLSQLDLCEEFMTHEACWEQGVGSMAVVPEAGASTAPVLA